MHWDGAFEVKLRNTDLSHNQYGKSNIHSKMNNKPPISSTKVSYKNIFKILHIFYYMLEPNRKIW
jgi:hypothetical protein